ncbi:Cytochrome b5-like Heme/Steroid binding domain-containing protein [Spironucleus salmonicida]|uniref:Cytochrome b5 domain-containing protein 1 n=1 Tax=Spironucleus salmonicida TaxID=348837 RepID=V6LQP3_9EUKA|nr:Cytochrome b5-like Heme/Steroid binding domain-containing protein [Spironucleus salmonicida]|eukprot:EST46568.1 Cytochrome b5-like Heme/Steroid binding domain-containing protein [Spironucleus salmonicida]
MHTHTFFTPKEIKEHCTPSDCWVSKFGKVYDYTNLIKRSPAKLVEALSRSAGEDVSSWFDPTTGDFYKISNPLDENDRYRLPLGLPTLHTADVYSPIQQEIDHQPITTVDAASPTVENPWWRDQSYCIGNLTKNAREIDILNSLTSQKHRLEVADELTIAEIAGRYNRFNSNCLTGYQWRFDGQPLKMDDTLTNNKIMDERPIFLKLGWPQDQWHIPCIILVWKDECM